MQKRILIVDDEPAIRDMVAFALRKAEYEPLHAGDAREASAAIVEQVPDLILLDWMLPGMSGLDLARRLRQMSPERPPVLATVTGFSDYEHLDRAVDAGFDLHFTKPANPDEVIDQLRDCAKR